MKTHSRCYLPIISILLAVLFTQGCVTKERYLTQVSKSQTFREQLKSEQQKRGDLEKEAVGLKKRIEDIKAELRDAKKRAVNTEKSLRKTLAARKQQRDVAMDMGAFIERSLNKEIQRLKDELVKMKRKR
jgi:uncharacterized protein YlxW (UPF0749 family)